MPIAHRLFRRLRPLSRHDRHLSLPAERMLGSQPRLPDRVKSASELIKRRANSGGPHIGQQCLGLIREPISPIRPHQISAYQRILSTSASSALSRDETKKMLTTEGCGEDGRFPRKLCRLFTIEGVTAA
jgi:hypothetical protein